MKAEKVKLSKAFLIGCAVIERQMYKEMYVQIPVEEDLEHWPLTLEPARWDDKINKTIRDEVKALGGCRTCGREIVSSGFCGTHYETYKATKKERYRRRKNAGLCVVCNHHTSNGRIYCVTHAKLSNEAHTKRSRRRKELGLCKDCGKTVVVGRTRCAKCKNKQREQRENRTVE